MATKPMASTPERPEARQPRPSTTREGHGDDAGEYTASIARITALGTSIGAWVLMVLALGLIAALLIG